MRQVLSKVKSNWQLRPFLYSILVMIFCLGLWFIPYSNKWCEQIDQQFFLAVNKTLMWSPYWQQFWGWLNHPAESWLNLVLMVTINFLVIVWLPKEQRKHAIIFVVYCWLLFQLGLLLSHLIFHKWLAIERASPSLAMSSIIKLSELVRFSVKDYSENSFPAGHTFVLIYWAGFTVKYASKKFKFLTYLITIILIFPRLISGAHWLSDVIFTIVVSYAWLAAVLGTPLYSYFVASLGKQKYLEKLR